MGAGGVSEKPRAATAVAGPARQGQKLASDPPRPLRQAYYRGYGREARVGARLAPARQTARRRGARSGASPLGASRASRAREDGLWWRGRAGLSCASGDRATDGYPSRAQALNSSRDDGMAPLRSREGLPWPAHPEEDGRGGRDGVTACPSLRVGETRSRRTRGNGSGGRRGHRISRVLREHLSISVYCLFSAYWCP